MRFLSAMIAAALLLPLGAQAADDTKPKSLDEQLLDDLDTDLLPKVEPQPVKPSTPAAIDRAPRGENSGLDEKLLDDLGEGEDIELGPEADPLTQIGRRMRQVETLIDRRDTSARTQDMQKQILRELDMLLEQTKKQCQGACQNPSSGQPKPGATANNQPKQGEQGPPKESTDKLRDPKETKIGEAENMDQLVREAWGHLPDKIRVQMQNVTVEQFLPKYEELIEAYYKRLAEEPRP
jgi:hypothetical protein